MRTHDVTVAGAGDPAFGRPGRGDRSVLHEIVRNPLNEDSLGKLGQFGRRPGGHRVTKSWWLVWPRVWLGM